MNSSGLGVNSGAAAMTSGSALGLGSTNANVGGGGGWGFSLMGVLGIVGILALIGVVIYIFVYKPRTMPREGFATAMGSRSTQANGTKDKREGFATKPTGKREGFLGGLFGGVDEAVENAREPNVPFMNEVGSTNTATAPVEGFFGAVARGAGAPDCLRVLPDAARVASALNDGSDDARELMTLAGKLACFKKDAIGTAQVIEATRYQPFNTSHDLQPITETMSMCFAKNLPKRDLDLIFGKYRSRGIDLITKLALSQEKSDSELSAYEKSFNSAMNDVTALAEQVCMGDSNSLLQGGGAISMNEVGRVEGVTTDDVATLRPYDGYY
jgi:hypothetical protein